MTDPVSASPARSVIEPQSAGYATNSYKPPALPTYESAIARHGRFARSTPRRSGRTRDDVVQATATTPPTAP